MLLWDTEISDEWHRNPERNRIQRFKNALCQNAFTFQNAKMIIQYSTIWSHVFHIYDMLSNIMPNSITAGLDALQINNLATACATQRTKNKVTSLKYVTCWYLVTTFLFFKSFWEHYCVCHDSVVHLHGSTSHLLPTIIAVLLQ